MAIIEAPVETVLKLLELQNFGKWIDGKVEKIHPEGPMVIGQEATMSTEAFMLTWKATMKVVGVDKAKRKIRYDVFLPFGMKVEEELQYAPLSDKTCEVRYNCNIIFHDGIRGFILKTILGRAMIAGPADSIRRLKAEAEKEYMQSKSNTPSARGMR